MAKNNIKGLTVEIGGDTTQLGKALDNVNNKSRDLSAELGQINKLLKMDPKNSDLLAQKQKVLADAVANTSEKLDKLKEAEKQVQKQFERGEVSEEQVRALKREIIATEKALDGYEKAAEETADQIKKLGKHTDDATEKTNKFGAAAKAVGKVAVISFKGVAAGVAAASTALVAAAEGTREYRTEMGKLDTAFESSGHSSAAAQKTYKALQGVLGETDQAVEAANHLAKLTDNEKDLQKWTDICTGVYATFGASLPIEGLTEAANETAKVGQVTGPLADALNWAGVSEDAFNESLAACTDEQERQTLIMETLSGLYDDAATKYRETNAEVIRANEANEAWTASLAEVGGAVEPLLSDVKLLGASMLSDLVPGIKEVTSALGGMLAGEEGAADALGDAVGDMLGGLLDKASALIPSIVEVGISMVTSTAEAVVEELPNLVQTIADTLVTCVPQLIDGAVTLLLSILDAIQLIIPPLVDAIPAIAMSIIDALVDAIPQLIDGAVEFLLAIVKAIPIIIKKLLPQVPTIVDAVIDGLLDNIPALVDGAVELLMAILDAIPEINAALTENGPSIVMSIVDGLLGAIPQLIKAGGQLLQGLVDGMLDFDIWGAVKGIGDSIINGFKNVFDIHSPSRVMAELGELLDEGLAVGIEDNANAPTKAMNEVSSGVIDAAGTVDGVAIDRHISHTYSVEAAATAAQNAGMLGKLDAILKAIEAGKVIALDGDRLVGGTVNKMNNALGQRRILAERGAV